MKVYIMTDMEGCAGILDHDNWVTPQGRYYEAGRRILTEEVNAAIEGFLEGGATQIVVCDGHGFGGIDPLQLHEKAELIRGVASPPYPFWLDRSYDAIAHVGQHAKAGTPFSHITHTGWFSAIDCTVNGISVGEYGEMCLCAMELGVPSIFASGEEAFCREAEALTPGVVTVAVKRGLLPDGLEHLTTDQYKSAKLAACHLHHHEACRRIRLGAAAAARKWHLQPESFSYPQIHRPYVRINRVRGDGTSPPYTVRADHPDSLIALMNSPGTRLE